MKIKNIRSLNPKEIETKMNEINMDLMKLEGQKATGTNPKSPGTIKKYKKTIAKMNLIISEKFKGGDSKQK